MNRARALRVAGLAARAPEKEEGSRASEEKAAELGEAIEEEELTTASAARASTASLSWSGARMPVALDATTSAAATASRHRSEPSSIASLPRNRSTAATDALLRSRGQRARQERRRRRRRRGRLDERGVPRGEPFFEKVVGHPLARGIRRVTDAQAEALGVRDVAAAAG